jgi:hypothetical protein
LTEAANLYAESYQQEFLDIKEYALKHLRKRAATCLHVRTDEDSCKNPANDSLSAAKK